MLEELKLYLNITNNDSDVKLSMFLDMGQDHLKSQASNLDFNVNGRAKALLFDYCRYAHNEILELFDANFRTQIFNLNIGGALDEIEITDNSPE